MLQKGKESVELMMRDDVKKSLYDFFHTQQELRHKIS